MQTTNRGLDGSKQISNGWLELCHAVFLIEEGLYCLKQEEDSCFVKIVLLSVLCIITLVYHARA